jgi:hypothetical protein
MSDDEHDFDPASDLWELFKERAAIRQYDGGASREHAEFLALRDVQKIRGEAPKWLLERIETERRSD